jgi:putative peptide zinc metalloprotease protein
VRLAWNEGLIDPPPLAVRLAGAVVLLQVIALAFQTLVFLRTDLYAVLVTALGCFNLYRVSALVLRRRFRVLRPAEATELAAAHPRDRRVANWFAPLSLLGVAAAAWMFVVWFVPATAITAGWLFASLGGAPLGSTSFWQALALGSVAGLQAIVPLVVFIRERVRGVTS